ncbi:riboflavin synthase subunit alpha [Thermococcus litoralis DSM 5473]|uniref:Riboflavin synthase n=1 Tax=Thermococcus litoralis (strain ATCC 51850 / DSM 5473 / JCM 8560 / NS-C) TaxID=523849 RepID=H3ZM87_THELN|nr:riboflavin synthase [Thermococcus litoralis]EHR78935.1 riboflavin synthase subunit alpha [Thermococcus litoralis DSM 5473]
MFSGIIEKVAKARYSRGKLYVEKVLDVNLGDSVAVNGACLTVSEIRDRIIFDVGEETLKKTNLAKAKLVNLERALKFGDRIDGHLVTGHVDGTLKLRRVLRRGNTYWLAFEMPKERFGIVEKGSIALNGISLTIAKVEKSHFWVQVIPYTWENTNLKFLRIGDEVNYEIDVVARYLRDILGDKYGLGKA